MRVRRVTLLEELLLLNTGETGSLSESQRLKDLHLATNFRRQARHKAREKEGLGKAHHTICELLEF